MPCSWWVARTTRWVTKGVQLSEGLSGQHSDEANPFIVVIFAKNRSTWLSQLARVGVKCRW